MMPNFQNQKWKLKVSRSVSTLPSNRILNLGLQFVSQYLIVQVSVANQQDTWHVAGKIWATSLIFAAPTKFFEKDLTLSERELITIPKTFERQYILYYRAPRYFTNVKLKIWEYLGEISQEDSLTERINFLTNQNLGIEESIRELINKVDNILIPDNSPTEQQKQLLPFF